MARKKPAAPSKSGQFSEKYSFLDYSDVSFYQPFGYSDYHDPADRFEAKVLEMSGPPRMVTVSAYYDGFTYPIFRVSQRDDDGDQCYIAVSDPTVLAMLICQREMRILLSEGK